MPVQLTQQAMDTLQHLSPDFPPVESGPIIEVPQTQPSEMQERGLNINLIAPAPSPPKVTKKMPSSEPVSAISIPSPGGFFSSLDSTSKRTWSWSQMKPHEPSTTTAECFYDVPWDHHMDQVKEHVIDAGDENESDGPPTARQENFPASQTQSNEPHEMVIKGNRQYEYDEEYERKLHQTAASNMSRTSLWLSAQEQYLSALKESNPLNEASSPQATSAPSDFKSPSDVSKEVFSSSKKAVRFADPKPKTPVTAIRAPDHQSGAAAAAAQSDPLFYFAFQHLLTHSRPVDAHKLRHLRADAVQAQRAHITASHRAQLRGQYAVAAPQKPVKDFGHLPSAPNDPATQKQREEVARIDRERKALQQLNLSCWHMEASKFLTGGCLLPRAASDAIASAKSAGRTPRILDLGGLPTADWGWAIALEHREVKVYTAVIEPLKSETEDEDTHSPHWSQHRCPSNHRTLTVSTPYTLPFPAGSFDVVSARTLHSLCRTTKAAEVQSPTYTSPASASALEDFHFPFSPDVHDSANRGALPTPPVKKPHHFSDEYAATLAEIRRVLAPGGVLAYEFMDAEVAPASSVRKDSAVSVGGGDQTALHARSVEFAVALTQRGFDACAGHRSLARLAEAGFAKDRVRENKVELPVGGADEGIGAISEVVGGVKWERWMLATLGEKGLDGVAQAMEAARRCKNGGVAWRVVQGVAQV